MRGGPHAQGSSVADGQYSEATISIFRRLISARVGAMLVRNTIVS